MEEIMRMKYPDSERKEAETTPDLDRRTLLRSSALAGGALAMRGLLGDGVLAAGWDDPPLAATRAGKVRGAIEDGIYVFKGIPYGAAPTGPLRFRAPVPPAPWTGIRDALKFGDQCPQVLPPVTAAWRSWARQVGESEDC